MHKIIEIENFSFTIGEKEILKNISLTVDKGEYLSIIGPNGAGKTTLLKCINRILTGGRGIIRLNGRPVTGYSRKELAKWISYVPQSDGPVPPFTAREFVLMGRYPHLSPFTPLNREDEQAAEHALALTGAVEFAERALDTLSGGERQKVFIAAALAQGAGILLLDEPTTFLDPAHHDDILETLKRINRESGITIISVTHDINSAALMGGRVLALKEGSAVFRGTAEAVMDNAILEQVYDKTFLFVTHPRTGQSVIVPG